jgi:glutaredoxin 3
MGRRITLYTKTGCPYCAAKREEFVAERIPFVEINVTERPEVIPELLKLTRGERVVPVIVDGDRVSIAPEGG